MIWRPLKQHQIIDNVRDETGNSNNKKLNGSSDTADTKKSNSNSNKADSGI